MKKMTLCQKIRWAVYYCPTLLPSIINDPNYNKKITLGILNDLLPRRTSIEIECMDSLLEGLNLTNTTRIEENSIIPHFQYPKIAKLYNIHQFGIDPPLKEMSIDYTEHKISILNHTQLSGLYNILNDMIIHCSLNTKSGCHIHLDISKTISKFAHTYPKYLIHKKLEIFFTHKIQNGIIDNIFGIYDGTYNGYKGCELNNKGAWIAIRDELNSLEFRTPPMTFNYSTIIKWFIAVNKLLNEFEYSITKGNSEESPKEVVEEKYEVCAEVCIPIPQPSTSSATESTAYRRAYELSDLML